LERGGKERYELEMEGLEIMTGEGGFEEIILCFSPT
jgi:hypothetical protein